MTADVIRIQGLKLSRATSSGRRVVARFDLDLCGVEIVGCELIRTASDGLTVRGPVGVIFVKSSMQHAVREAAQRAYIALGGDDLPDWALGQVDQQPSGQSGQTGTEAVG